MYIYRFELNERESKDALKFVEKHKNCFYKNMHKPYLFRACGNTSFIFTHGGIGLGVEIRCNVCGEIEDITDVSSW